MAAASAVVVEDLETDEKRDQTTQDFLTGLKERESLKEQLDERQKELTAVKSQNYDLTKQVADLQNQISELKNGNGVKKHSNGKQATGGGVKKSGGKHLRPAKRKAPKKNATSPSKDAEKNDDPFDDPELLYEKISERYPDLSISTVLTAERKFVEADVNRDGTIDAEELERILDNSKTMFTKQQVLEILNEIDKDNTNSIDFFECLQVLDLLRQKKNSHLPSSIERNRSAICSIQ